MPPRRSLDRSRADDIAVAALTFIGADPNRLTAFLAATGLTPESLRQAAGSPGFFGGVLDYVIADETLLVALAAEIGAKPETVAQAWQVLRGPEPDFSA